jgi:dihydrofolate reductase
MKNISIIVAIAENNAIGKDNKLLWHISEDLKRFKRLTTGHTVIMGENTYESLPVKPLPNRTNIVITHIPGKKFDNCETVYSIIEAIDRCPENDECFVIGGGSVYKQFLEIANRLYITRVHKEIEGDTFFPVIDTTLWKLIEKEEAVDDAKNNFKYNYETYLRNSL